MARLAHIDSVHTIPPGAKQTICVRLFPETEFVSMHTVMSGGVGDERRQATGIIVRNRDLVSKHMHITTHLTWDEQVIFQGCVHQANTNNSVEIHVMNRHMVRPAYVYRNDAYDHPEAAKATRSDAQPNRRQLGFGTSVFI
jgi:hypothetical protein